MRSRLLWLLVVSALSLLSTAAAARADIDAGEVAVAFKAPAARAATAGTPHARVRILRYANASAAARAVRRLRRRSDVAWARPHYIARAAAFTPNDTGLAVASGGTPGAWQEAAWDLLGPFGIDAPGAWDLATAARAQGGRGVIVGIVDTGVAYADRSPYRRSPELPMGRIRRGYDFVSHDPYPNDRSGHGTFVASTIAAAANNGYGMVGIAYKADILPVRVLNASGEGSPTGIAAGIRYAVDHGADVINLSIEFVNTLNLSPYSITSEPEVRSAIAYAAAHRVIVVAASGNSGDDAVPSLRLGSKIIYVGGTTEHGCLGDYTNYGPGLDLVAPGGGDDASVPGDPNCQAGGAPGRNVVQITFQNHRYATFRVPHDASGRPGLKGTSMAAPHVTGVVALLLASGALGQSPTTATVQERLTATARQLGVADPRYYGAGLLDAAAALRGTKTPPPTTSG
jgi:serine protease